ncbi:hypothetical protein F5Y12DRAFT_798597 [Xylaria sp. FL1777]|nr:hypothetical protein F5Y12DRAFT_798597 [Xylaria sp. FL1777]
MDPLSALGVAAAAVQFLDFGCRVLADTRKIYKSSTGSSTQSVELWTVSRDLVTLTTEVEAKLGAAKWETENAGASEQVFVRLCDECRDISRELQDMISKVQAKGITKLKLAMASFVQALNGMHSPAKIEQLKERLNQARQQMMMAVLVFLWGHAQRSGINTIQFAEQQAALMATVQRIDETTRNFGANIVNLIQGQTGESQREAHAMVHYVLDSDGLDSEWAADDYKRLPALDPVNVSAESRNRKFATKIVDSLLFKTIDHREEAIPKAYGDTFGWIFQEPRRHRDGTPLWSDFTEWLQGESKGMYWITGKPGSGKSTLIKFLASDRRLDLSLRKWANGSNLLLATYFSWNAGNNLQKSLEGLLRTLLHQCLRQYPELLVPIVFPSRWALVQVFVDNVPLPDWKLEDLLTGFRILIAQAGKKLSKDRKALKLALMIDGLDEFEGDHNRVISLLQNASLNPDIKICTSSRPWNLFKDTFKQNPMLQLEDLTEPDIQLYVRGRFENSEGFNEHQVLYPEQAQKLTESIVEKARGVFLWVAVVVRNLLVSLQEGDTLSDLQANLDGLPDDLSKLFRVMWEQTKSQYHGEASQYFLILDAYEKYSITPYSVSIWMGVKEDSLDLDVSAVNNAFLTSAVSFLSRRLNSRTKGLLEICYPAKGNTLRGTSVTDSWVDYMHRTAREWVQENWQIIQSTAIPDFEPRLRLLRGEVLRMSLDTYLLPNDRWQFGTHIGQLFEAARAVEDTPSNASELVQVLDKLDHRITVLSRTRKDISIWQRDFTMFKTGVLPHCCDGAPSDTSYFDDSGDQNRVNFLGVMAQIPIPSYIKFKVTDQPDVVHTAEPTVPLLWNIIYGGVPYSAICRSLRVRPSTTQERLDLLGFLLEHSRLADVKSALGLVCSNPKYVAGGMSVVVPNAEYFSSVAKVLQDYVNVHDTTFWQALRNGLSIRDRVLPQMAEGELDSTSTALTRKSKRKSLMGWFRRSERTLPNSTTADDSD